MARKKPIKRTGRHGFSTRRHPAPVVPTIAQFIPRNRPEVIAQYRAMMYRDYLKTEWWRKVKKGAIRRAGFKCNNCKKGNVPLEVHHLTYERLGTEHDDDVVALCHGCHIQRHIQTVSYVQPNI